MEFKMAYKFSMIKVTCIGTIKGCDKCKDTDFDEGYCSFCSRPLWKKIGDPCNFILGYYEPDSVERTKAPKLNRGKYHQKCKFCNTMTTF
jgi:hypothetical protein